MDRSLTESPITAIADDRAEPRHLHFDRRTRTWLAHAENGVLLPYERASGPSSGDSNGAGKVAA